MTMDVRDIGKADIPLAVRTLTEAFRSEPLFEFVFRDRDEYARVAPWMFTSWLRWAVRYGKAWASPSCQAVALRRVPDRSDMNFWTTLTTGIAETPFRLGWKNFRRLTEINAAMIEQRHAIMGRQPYWYCQNIAVLPECQGQGLGRALMQHTFAQADAQGLPCYLETSTERNVAIHGRQGYELRGMIEPPGSSLKMALMVRPPQTVAIGLPPSLDAAPVAAL